MKIEEISRKFGEREVLKNINLDFDKNGMVFILGASGSGKSTLLNVLGLLDDNYDGKIYYDAENVLSEAQKTNIRRKHIAFIFQEYNLVNSLTVRENIQTAADISEGVLNEELYNNIISEFKLNNLEDRDVSTLSGGEKQRVAIARALLRNNEIIFADEPTGNLDEENSEIIFNALKDVAENHLVIIVSHNKEAAEKFADRIITIRDGKIFDDIDKGYFENSALQLNEQRETNPKSKRWIRRISVRSFQKRKKKLIPSIIAIFISLLCIGVVCGILSSIAGLMNNANASLVEADMVNIEVADDYYKEPVSDKFIESINNTNNVKKLMRESGFALSLPSVDHEGFDTGVSKQVITLDDFFKERIKPQMGKMISNDKEILISSYFAEYYFGSSENAIGKTLKFSNSNIEVKIVGIYDTLVTSQSNYVVITDGLQKALFKEELDESIISLVDDDDVIYTNLHNSNSKEKIICGQPIKNKNEALLSIKSINNYLKDIYREDLYLSQSEISSGKISKEVQDLVIGLEYNVSTNGVIIGKVKITGICRDNESKAGEYTDIYVNDEDKLLWSENMATNLTVYLNDYSDEKTEEIKTLAEENEYKFIYPAENIKKGFSEFFSVIGIAVAVVALIIMIISCILVSHTTKSNISDRVYEVGVLKSLGADKKSIFKMFGTENLIVGIISSISAILVIIILNIAGLPNWATVYNLSCYQFDCWHIIAIIFVGLFITMVSGLGKINKASKMSVTDAIRTKNI